MRRIITAFLMIAVLTAVAMSQWQFSRTFLPTGLKLTGNGVHGIAVGKDGKVWIQPYDVSDSVLVASTGKYGKVRAIYVYNPDGSAVDTIKTILIGSVRDTLYNSGRGIASDPTGDNIYASFFDVVYKINATTRQGVSKSAPLTSSITKVAVDSLGEIFIAFVLDGIGPIKIYGSNMAFIGNVVDTSRGFSRTIAVSNNGNDVYFPGYTKNTVIRYRSNNGSLGPYTVASTDTLLKGAVCESMEWNRKTGHLWVSTGYNSLPPTAGSFYGPATWYAFNTTTKTVQDGFVWKAYPGKNVDPRPRGIAFSRGGDTCYVGVFNLDTATVQMWTRIPTRVERLSNEGLVPSGYALEQNYPNPFNPTTTIQFTLAKAGFAQLFVYDMVGRDVATLVNQDMNAGTFKVSFDASRLASGTYIYELRSGDARITKKMMLLK